MGRKKKKDKLDKIMHFFFDGLNMTDFFKLLLVVIVLILSDAGRVLVKSLESSFESYVTIVIFISLIVIALYLIFSMKNLFVFMVGFAFFYLSLAQKSGYFYIVSKGAGVILGLFLFYLIHKHYTEKPKVKKK